jgi:hypothetical protein
LRFLFFLSLARARASQTLHRLEVKLDEAKYSYLECMKGWKERLKRELEVLGTEIRSKLLLVFPNVRSAARAYFGFPGRGKGIQNTVRRVFEVRSCALLSSCLCVGGRVGGGRTCVWWDLLHTHFFCFVGVCARAQACTLACPPSTGLPWQEFESMHARLLINPNNVEQKVHPSYLCFHFDQEGQRAVLACPYHPERSIVPWFGKGI